MVLKKYLFTSTAFFMLSTLVVHVGNYLYNLILARTLLPALFAQASLLVLFLLAFSFLAMTFQIVATKFSIELDGDEKEAFKTWISKKSLWIGVLLALVFFAFSRPLAAFFKMKEPSVFYVYAFSIPLFFLMSVQRGILQGQQRFVALASSYQVEMWVRFLVMFALIYMAGMYATLSVSISIVLSIVAGYAVASFHRRSIGWSTSTSFFQSKRKVISFFWLTAAFEGTQVVINYADILLVKHYFDAYQAGLYTSVALIGRIIYFIMWMLAMVLVPIVLDLRKRGLSYMPTFYGFLSFMLGFLLTLIGVSFGLDQTIVLFLFGEEYLPVAHLLWMYALATMLFAIANLLVYLFLSIDHKIPVYISIVFALIQIILFIFFHASLQQMMLVQIITMSCLLIVQLAYFFQVKMD